MAQLIPPSSNLSIFDQVIQLGADEEYGFRNTAEKIITYFSKETEGAFKTAGNAIFDYFNSRTAGELMKVAESDIPSVKGEFEQLKNEIRTFLNTIACIHLIKGDKNPEHSVYDDLSKLRDRVEIIRKLPMTVKISTDISEGWPYI